MTPVPEQDSDKRLPRKKSEKERSVSKDQSAIDTGYREIYPSTPGTRSVEVPPNPDSGVNHDDSATF